MKYGDAAWTEPEPAGADPALIDGRIADKAYTAPPPGGFLTVGGTDDEVALNPGRLPGGHAPIVPLPPTQIITVPGGAVDVAAVITLTGTFLAGSYIDVTRDASGDPAGPVGAPYPIDVNMSAEALAMSWASYLSVGIGYAVSVSGAVITLTPDAGQSIVLSALALTVPAPLQVLITTAAGDTAIPAELDLVGSANPGDSVIIVVTTGVEAITREWIAPSVQSGLTVAKSLASMLRAIPGADSWNKNLTANVLANSGNATVNIDSVTVTLSVPGLTIVNPGGLDTQAQVQLTGPFQTGDSMNIDIDVGGTVTSAVIAIVGGPVDARDAAQAFADPQYLGSAVGVTISDDGLGMVLITPDPGVTVTVTAAVYTPAAGQGGGDIDTNLTLEVTQPAGSQVASATVAINGLVGDGGTTAVIKYDTDSTDPHSVGVPLHDGMTIDELGAALAAALVAEGVMCEYQNGVLYIQPEPPAQAVAITSAEVD